MTEAEYNALTERVIGIAIAVHRHLGPGQDEALYEEAMRRLLLRSGIRCESQVALPLVYDGVLLDCGYRIDLLVEGALVIELKAVATLIPAHDAQLLTYLRLSGHKLGLLINFNVLVLKDGIRRRVHGLGLEIEPFKPWFLSTLMSGLSGVVISAAMKVHSKIGPGLLRSAYLKCLAHELESQGVTIHRNLKCKVSMDNVQLDHAMQLELVVSTSQNVWLPLLILSVDQIARIHESQFRSKLRLTGWESGLILNFNAPLLKEGLRHVGSARKQPGVYPAN